MSGYCDNYCGNNCGSLSVRAPSFALFVLQWHFVQIGISGFNWRFFVGNEESLLGVSTPRIHLAFCIIGLLVYLFVASVLIYWPYKYHASMLPKNRRNRLMLGSVLVYFTHVLPIWIIEFGILWTYGWLTLMQGIAFIFITVSWIVETLGVWYGYIWYASGFLQKNYGDTVFGRGGL